jgi:hypothetical protein
VTYQQILDRSSIHTLRVRNSPQASFNILRRWGAIPGGWPGTAVFPHTHLPVFVVPVGLLSSEPVPPAGSPSPIHAPFRGVSPQKSLWLGFTGKPVDDFPHGTPLRR